MTTKRQLVDTVAKATGVSLTKTDKVVDCFLEQLVEVIAQDDRLELRNFGVFKTVELGARTGRNPQTGEPVDIPGSRHVRFKMSKRMKQRLNQG